MTKAGEWGAGECVRVWRRQDGGRSSRLERRPLLPPAESDKASSVKGQSVTSAALQLSAEAASTKLEAKFRPVVRARIKRENYRRQNN